MMMGGGMMYSQQQQSGTSSRLNNRFSGMMEAQPQAQQQFGGFGDPMQRGRGQQGQQQRGPGRGQQGSGQRGPGGRGSPCSDMQRPTCLDGSQPQRDPSTGQPMCLDGSSPTCSDGTVPSFGGGRVPGGGRGSPCIDQSRPSCADGSQPQKDPVTGQHMCMDGSSPLCADGSSPDPSLRPQGGRPNGNRPNRPSCLDGSRPACADGLPYTYDFTTMTRVCSDGVSVPVCADGSTPAVGGGDSGVMVPGPITTPTVPTTPTTPTTCPDGLPPVCSDQTRPFFDANGEYICADGTRPACARSLFSRFSYYG